MPVEVRSLAGTLRRWRAQIIAWHTARVSNGPTEALNNLIKRVKRVAFGMRRFRHYRIRVLLYAGRPNWDLSPRSHPAEIRSAAKAGGRPLGGVRVTGVFEADGEVTVGRPGRGRDGRGASVVRSVWLSG